MRGMPVLARHASPTDWSPLPTTQSATQLRGRPERVFVSVDESTGKSTMSFHPAEVGSPVQHDGDLKGEAAMKEARSIAERRRRVSSADGTKGIRGL